ncbi:MAG: hypothetical protein LBT14_01725 [Treponema sp.]|jgi:hypothetical protein|nr:hypothetical protein [Treponema sp.]
MKKIFRLFWVILTFGLVGCSSISHYADLANEYSFEYFFPSYSFHRTFSTIDEAYDFVNTASAKFSKSVNKSSAKGLAAKLIGPAVITDNPVAVGCFFRATNSNSDINLSKIDKPLEIVLRDAISATIVFLVFYNDRAVSISDYHLQEGYVYTSNSQMEGFKSFGNSYETNYPVGWGIEKAFHYLKGEIN